VDDLPVAEILPGLYRNVLDAVADLEGRGRRPEAAAIRGEAIGIYSRAWTADAARRLRSLLARAGRIADARTHGRYQTVAVEVPAHAGDMERRTA
jgi:hypothetical protein